MNQLVGEKENGSKFLGLILEPGNLHRLQQGEPITLRVEDMFPNGVPRRLELAIFYSETPVGDARELTKMAEVTLDERTPAAKKMVPHCPQCRSTIEQLGVWKSEGVPIWTIFCAQCGCVLGVTANPEAK